MHDGDTGLAPPTPPHVTDGEGRRVPAKPRQVPRGEGGFSLVEVIVAAGLLAASLVVLARLLVLATESNIAARHMTAAAVLAQQKVEELRALTWGLDTEGLPISDTATDTAVDPEQPNGGTGLSPSPATALRQNTSGWVDYLDQSGNKLGGGADAPRDAVYARRWAIEPLPTDPNDTLVIQVLVTRHPNRATTDTSPPAFLPDEVRLITIKTRKAW